MATKLDVNDVYLYSTDEVCAVLRLSQPTLRKLIHAGQLSAKRVGSRWLIPSTAVAHYLGVDCSRPQVVDTG